MHSGSHEHLSQKSHQIKQESKSLTRRLSKESSTANNSSFRIYYGGSSVAVPFRWESQPGTPKHTFSDSTIPPLTPPPSYFSTNSYSNSMHKYSKQNLLRSIFPRLTPRKTHHSTPSSLSSLSSSSSSFSSWSSSMSSSCSSPSTSQKVKFFKHRRFSSSGLPIRYSLGDDHDEQADGGSSCTSSAYGVPYKRSSGFRGCYGNIGMVNAKKALFSILGQGSAGRSTAA